MKGKTRIVVAGIGGVGGYFGGLLAKKYHYHKGIEVVFFTRGEHLSTIHGKGLTIVKGAKQTVVMPDLVTDNPEEIGVADFIILATKSYDLEEVIHQLTPCIGPETTLLPLLNGVDSVERIKIMVPTTTVLSGCVYIVAQIKSPGVVENSGNIERLFFGLQGQPSQRLTWLEGVLKDAGIDAYYSVNIERVVWEKFIFLSPTASATSYFDAPVGVILRDHLETVEQLIREVRDLAVRKGIPTDPDIASKTIDSMRSLPFDTTTSMHRDFMKGNGRNELETLTGYVVREADKLGVRVAAYTDIYEGLSQRLKAGVQH